VHWFNITAVSTRDRLVSLEDRLWNQGAVSVTVEDAADSAIYEPPLGEQPIWQQVVVTGLFGADARLEEISAALKEEGFEVALVDKVKDRDWEREWMNRFDPMQFGNQLWVCPTGFDKSRGIVIQMDPGLAFGTGTHETTRLCLVYLDGLDVTGWS
ncbi:uncharacterized protein METZ01_LOCUS336976, partial [marine metagenome]